MRVRAKDERGVTKIDWLESYHSFSFGDYYDSNHMGFSDLRVINDDIVKPGKGFDTHGHHDMEIITYVISGTLAHKDSLGNGSLIQAGDVQCMTAGKGIRHSEFNPSDTESVQLLQIWIKPNQLALEPGYIQKTFEREARLGAWQLLVSPDARDGSLPVNQDVCVYATILPVGSQLGFDIKPGRSYWIQIGTGVIQVNGRLLEAGDGIALDASDIDLLLEGLSRESEVLLFELRLAN